MAEENKPKELTIEECCREIGERLIHIENQLAEQGKRSMILSSRNTTIAFLASIIISGLVVLITGAVQLGINAPILLVYCGSVLVILGSLFMFLVSLFWKPPSLTV